MDTEISENDLLSRVETPAEPTIDSNPLHELQSAIAAIPDIDMEKVQAVLNKLQGGSLDILGDDEACLASSQRIAQKILEEFLEVKSE